MCGICGIAYSDPNRPVERQALQRMTDILHHRGPDGEGLFVTPGVGLGFRRLAIVDLETGNQPIGNEDDSIVVVCNGEIYNHVELRQRLATAGHRFRTASDAEGLFFGSEQKAILACGAVAPDPDVQSLRQLFSYGRIIGERTMITGIRRLQAGHYLTWENGQADLRQYWDASFPARHGYDDRTSGQEWAEGLRAKLTESVRLHLRSDVPLGAWLSAGIDSSAVTALMSRMVPPPVQTFTLRFDDPQFDELRNQKALDDYPQYGLAGHRILCTRADLERMPKGIWHAEDSLMSGVAVGQLMLAQATASHVKVVLTGEGSDEILGGYSWYRTMRVLDPVMALPLPGRRLLAAMPSIARRWPGAAGTIAGPREMNFDRYSRSITHLRSQSGGDRVFSANTQEELRRQGACEDAATPPAGFWTWHPFAQMQYFDIKYRLADSVVLGLDRASMAYSVEARVPFLDHELVEFCARIPPRLKMKWLREKHILRRAMEGVLPAAIVHRKKQPMQVPMDEWLRGELPPFAEELLSSRALRDTGYFSPEKVAALRKRHRTGQENVGQVLSAVLGTQIWHNLFCRASTARQHA